jgi:hypothetical protein
MSPAQHTLLLCFTAAATLCCCCRCCCRTLLAGVKVFQRAAAAALDGFVSVTWGGGVDAEQGTQLVPAERAHLQAAAAAAYAKCVVGGCRPDVRSGVCKYNTSKTKIT